MNKQIEAIKLAIEVFGGGDWHDEIVDTDWADKANNAITVLREALAEQPAQQEMTNIERHERNVQKFLAEQPAQQEPLTDEQLLAVIKKIDRDEQYIQSSLRHLARAIEAAHGITKGNT